MPAQDFYLDGLVSDCPDDSSNSAVRIIVRANGQNHAVVGGTLQLYQGAVIVNFLSCDPRLI